jgi:hypothetical protein
VARRSGEITCWGRTEQNRAVPFLDGGPRGSPNSFGVARNHACGIVAGKVQCWGSAAYRVPVVRDPVQVATGPFKNCARDRGGAVWWWGSTDGGIDTSQPLSGKLPARRVQGIEHAVDVSIATTHGCAVVASGKVDCWYAATAGHEAKAEPIAGIDDAIAVDANSLCAIRRGGWKSSNVHGYLGDTSTSRSSRSSAPRKSFRARFHFAGRQEPRSAGRFAKWSPGRKWRWRSSKQWRNGDWRRRKKWVGCEHPRRQSFGE